MSRYPTFDELVMLCAAAAMTRPTAENFRLIVTGWLFAPHHTITGMIRAAGLVGVRHHDTFHRIFATAAWSLDEFGLTFARLVLGAYRKNAVVFLAVDDTLARKRSRKIAGVGMHHDALLSSRGKAVMNLGHCWVTLGIVVRFPFFPGHWFCLPVLVRLFRPPKTVAREGGAAASAPELARQMLCLLCARFPARRFHLVADGAYSKSTILKKLPPNAAFTGRMRMDAALSGPPVPPPPHTRGRKPLKGKRLPSPEQMLADPDADSETIDLDIYGRRETTRVVRCTARWYGVAGARPLAIIATAPLTGKRKPQAFFSTCITAPTRTLLGWYARRWSIEVTFHDTKGHLGFEEPQGWTAPAVARTAPMALLLYGLTVLWFARAGYRTATLPRLPWYLDKRTFSFADMHYALTRAYLEDEFQRRLAEGAHMRKYAESLIDRLAMAA